MTDERSTGGSRIYRHGERTKDFELAIGESESIQKIEAHIERWLGKPEMVWHEIISDLVHVDVHVVAPRPDRNCYTLVTTGMSDRPMAAPEGAAQCRYAELLICLPPDWPMKQEDFEDERNYAPIRWLKSMARFPHAYDTWLWWAHTIPNGNPPEPFWAGTELCCLMLELPKLADPEFFRLEIDAEKVVHFFALVPLFPEELNLKLAKGAEELETLFDRRGVSELLDLGRPNVAKRKWLGIF